MPNKFSGRLTDTIGNPISDVKVTITGTGIPNGTSTTTNKNGTWSISIKNDIDNKDVTVIFSKKGLETKQIKNPNATAQINAYIDPILGGTLDLAEFYPSGKWKVTSLSSENQEIVKQELEDLYFFIKDNPASTIITITASESKVPNNDNEEGSNKDFKKPGSLAKARAEDLQKYVIEFLNKKYKEDPNAIPPEARPEITLGQIDQVGGPEWNPNDPTLKQEAQDEGVNNPALLNKFKQHQFAKLKVETNQKCSWSEVKEGSISGKFQTKNSALYTVIDFDPAVVPDIFIVESFDANGNKFLKQTDTFYQRNDKNSYGDLVTWGLLAFYSQDRKAEGNQFAWGNMTENEGLNLNKLQKGQISFEEGFNKIFNDMVSEFTEITNKDGKPKGSSGTIYYNFNALFQNKIQNDPDEINVIKEELDNQAKAKKYNPGSQDYNNLKKTILASKRGFGDPSKTTDVQKSKIKNDMKKYIFNNSDILTYYIVKKELYYSYNFKENNIPPNTDFRFKGIQGVFFGGSAYRYRMCY